MTVPPAPAPGDRAARLLAAAGRIRAHVADWPPGVLTTPDADTGERWDAGQLGVAFGRVKTDPDRVAAIERDRREHLSLLLGRIDEGVAEVLQLVDGLDGEALAREGTHQTLGRMTVAGIVDRFLVDHLEEHAEQIEGVVPPVP